MACANFWTSPFQVGSHHLAREFASRGWQVAFISDPLSPFHLLGGKGGELRERFRIYRNGGIGDLNGKLWSYVPFALATPHNKPFLRSDWVEKNWPSLSLPNVVLKAVRQGFGEVDLFYLDSVAQAFWLKYIKAGKTLFRIADNNSGFGKTTKAARQVERELVQKVDAVLYTAESLKKGIKALQPRKMYHLPNGVNFAHFGGPEPPRPVEYAKLPEPIVVYVGAMEEWFNFKWLRAAAGQLKDISFVLIGSARAAGNFAALNNVHFLGSRPYSEIPAYLRHAQAGIIPFDMEGHGDLVNSIHPLKLYEYMACGLPVVATAWRELGHLKSPAILARTEAQFIAGIQKAVARPGSRNSYRDYARQQDWSGRVDRLLKFLGALK